MPGYFGALTLVLLIAMVVARVVLLRRRGVEALNFGKTDKRDFLIPPFALVYVYLVLASAFDWPRVGELSFLRSDALAWAGVVLGLAGLALFMWALVSFGRSFRVGIDTEHPDRLVTSGAFAVSRNPIYTAFGLVVAGEFLIFQNWILLLYAVAGIALFHRQVLREEEYLKGHYGEAYREYGQRVRRYL